MTFTQHQCNWGGRVFFVCAVCHGRSPDYLPAQRGAAAAWRSQHERTAHQDTPTTGDQPC